MTPLDFVLALVVVVIWAFNFIAAKVAVTQLPSLMLLALRFAVVAVVLLPFMRRPGRRWRLVLTLSLVLGVMHFGPLFVGLEGVNAGPAAIAVQLGVPFSALIAAAFYRERLGRWQIVGMAVAFSGVYVLAGEPAAMPSLPHLALVVFAAFAWAVANILIKELGPINVFLLNAWIALLAAPQLLVASLVLERGQWQAIVAADWRAWAAIAYMAVGASITAYGLWYYLLDKYEVNRVVPLMLLAPVLAVFLAVLMLGEPLGARIVIGGAVTITGVAMIEMLRPAPPAADAVT